MDKVKNNGLHLLYRWHIPECFGLTLQINHVVSTLLCIVPVVLTFFCLSKGGKIYKEVFEVQMLFILWFVDSVTVDDDFVTCDRLK